MIGDPCPELFDRSCIPDGYFCALVCACCCHHYENRRSCKQQLHYIVCIACWEMKLSSGKEKSGGRKKALVKDLQSHHQFRAMLITNGKPVTGYNHRIAHKLRYFTDVY